MGGNGQREASAGIRVSDGRDGCLGSVRLPQEAFGAEARVETGTKRKGVGGHTEGVCRDLELIEQLDQHNSSSISTQTGLAPHLSLFMDKVRQNAF